MNLEEQRKDDNMLDSWKFIKPRCNGGLLSKFAENSAQLPSDVINPGMLPLRDFCGKQFHC